MTVGPVAGVAQSEPLAQHFDVIVCGAGSAGSVIAGRLSENPDLRVLVLEAGGSDDVPAVANADQWPLNLGSERDWSFAAEPDPALHGRSIALSMGKVLGGGSSINLMIWARGHRSDWEYFAAESGEPAWGYDAMLDAARAVGIPTYQGPNGRLMEEARGAAVADLRWHDGSRLSLFATYVAPCLGRRNLVVVPDALITRVIIEGNRAAGVEVLHDGALHRVTASAEVVLSLGAIHTPKVLMQSGIGDAEELRRVGIAPRQHLPGVGRNLQDHYGFDCVWEFPDDIQGSTQVGATLFWDSGLVGPDEPDLFACLGPFPKATPENAAKIGLADNSWCLFGSPTHPKSRGRIRLSGFRPDDPIRIEANAISHPDDIKSAITCVKQLREIANSSALSRFVKREVMPGNLTGADLDHYLRDAVTTYWHTSGSAKMGRDPMSVVDGHLNVYGIDNLRVADASIMPRITAANAMAPCVVIGELASRFIKANHRL